MEKVSRNTFLLPAILTATWLGSVLFGQLFRIEPFDQSAGGVLISDLVVGVSGVVVIWAALRKRISFQRDWLYPICLTWFTLLILTFGVNVVDYTTSQQLVAGAYLIRLTLLMALLPISVALYDLAWKRALLLRYLAYTTCGLLLLAGIIFVILPDFSVLVPLGWDPHVGRLTGTWLDPNYFGSFIALVFAVALAFEAKLPSQHRIWYWLMLLALWSALYLTFSRSALVTFLVAGMVVGLITSWRAALAVVVLTAAVFVLPSRFQSRVSEGIAFVGGQNASTTAAEVSAAPDPTASARLNSWKKALDVYRLQPVTGVGYNFYSYAQLNTGQVSEETVSSNRSAAGSDSSVLTMLATTGILGVLAYLAIFLRLFWVYWVARRREVWAVVGLGVLVALMVSALFNNTALYPHIVIPSLLLLGAAYRASLPKKGER